MVQSPRLIDFLTAVLAAMYTDLMVQAYPTQQATPVHGSSALAGSR
jgi:hypothetical protein